MAPASEVRPPPPVRRWPVELITAPVAPPRARHHTAAAGSSGFFAALAEAIPAADFTAAAVPSGVDSTEEATEEATGVAATGVAAIADGEKSWKKNAKSTIFLLRFCKPKTERKSKTMKTKSIGYLAGIITLTLTANAGLAPNASEVVKLTKAGVSEDVATSYVRNVLRPIPTSPPMTSSPSRRKEFHPKPSRRC